MGFFDALGFGSDGGGSGFDSGFGFESPNLQFGTPTFQDSGSSSFGNGGGFNFNDSSSLGFDFGGFDASDLAQGGAGLFDLINSFQGRDNSAGRAGEIQSQFNQRGIDATGRQLAETRADLLPFLQGGTEAFGRSAANATRNGFEGNIADILGGDAFKELRDERLRVAEGQLSSGGLTRSGTALQDISNIPTNLALQIEELLSGRTNNVANTGFNAAQNLGQFGSKSADSIASLIGGQGSALANGVFGDAKARQFQDDRRTQGIKDIAGSFGDFDFDFGNIISNA